MEAPKSVSRPKRWSVEVEEAYRFQLAGYRDENEYNNVQSCGEVERWPINGYVKKLKRRADGYFYYFNQRRECSDSDVQRTKIYVY